MVKITLHCPYCQSERWVKNGQTADGRQRYRCRTCQPQIVAYAIERAMSTPLPPTLGAYPQALPPGAVRY